MNSEALVKMLNAAMTAAFADDLGRTMNRRERLHDAALIIEERLRAFDDAEMSRLREVVELLREHHRAPRRCAARKHPALDREMRPWLDTYDGWAARVASAADASAAAAPRAPPAAKRPPPRSVSPGERPEEVPTPARKSARAAARRRSGDDWQQEAR